MVQFKKKKLKIESVYRFHQKIYIIFYFSKIKEKIEFILYLFDG